MNALVFFIQSRLGFHGLPICSAFQCGSFLMDPPLDHPEERAQLLEEAFRKAVQAAPLISSLNGSNFRFVKLSAVQDVKIKPTYLKLKVVALTKRGLVG